MNTTPPTITGCDHATEAASGNANAHFNFNWGTCSAVSFAWSAGTNRLFVVGSGLQPFQCGFANGLSSFIGAGHLLVMTDTSRAGVPLNCLPVASSAIARF